MFRHKGSHRSNPLILSAVGLDAAEQNGCGGIGLGKQNFGI
jgi:hypothetical protein